MPFGILMQVKSTAECSTRAFCNTFDLHSAIIGLENLFLSSFEWPAKTVFSVQSNLVNSRSFGLLVLF